MATAISEHQQNAVQSIDAKIKLNSQQIMHNGSTDPNLKCTQSNVKDSQQRLFGMSSHQFTPESGNPTDQTPQSPKESPCNQPNDAIKSPNAQSNDYNMHEDMGHRQLPPGAPHNYNPSKMPLVRPIGPSHPSLYSPQQSPQQQYLPGHRIAQQSGPTPTLNQLLQTSNTIQRMQNCYGPSPPTGPGSGPSPGSVPGPVPTSTPDSPYSQNWQHQAQNPYIHPPSNTSNSNVSQIYGNPSSVSFCLILTMFLSEYSSMNLDYKQDRGYSCTPT